MSYERNMSEAEVSNFSKYLAGKCKNIETPLNIAEIVREYMEESKRKNDGFSRSRTCLNYQVKNYCEHLLNASNMKEKDRIEQLFGLNAYVDPDTLKIFQRKGNVEVDRKSRITVYEAYDGSLTIRKEKTKQTKEQREWMNSYGEEEENIRMDSMTPSWKRVHTPKKKRLDEEEDEFSSRQEDSETTTKSGRVSKKKYSDDFYYQKNNSIKPPPAKRSKPSDPMEEDVPETAIPVPIQEEEEVESNHSSPIQKTLSPLIQIQETVLRTNLIKSETPRRQAIHRNLVKVEPRLYESEDIWIGTPSLQRLEDSENTRAPRKFEARSDELVIPKVEQTEVSLEAQPPQKPEEEEEVEVFQKFLLEYLDNMVAALDLKQLSTLRNEISEKMEETEAETHSGEIIQLSLNSCLAIITRSSEIVPEDEWFSLGSFLFLLKQFAIALKRPYLAPFILKVSEKINRPEVQSKMIPIDKVKTALETTYNIIFG